MKGLPKLWVSPVSREVLEAAWLVAAANRGELGIMASCGQVGPGAYTGLTPERFDRDCYLLTRSTGARPPVQRDHLMKGGEDPYHWLDRDLEHGFDGVHLHTVDPELALEIMDHYGDKLWYEVGPGEDDSRPIPEDLWERTAARASWFSFPTGCRIDGLGNRGEFDAGRVIAMARAHGVPVRAHNCDYLTSRQWREVAIVCDGLNVAPQLGVVQSAWYMQGALMAGLPTRDWVDACAADEKNLARWCKEPWQTVVAVGHYHYDRVEWRDRVALSCVEFMVGYISALLENVS